MADPYHLHRVGRFWYCDYVLHGVRVHRSTKCVAKPDATKRCDGWSQAIRDKADGKLPEKSVPTLRQAYDHWARVKKNQVSPSHFRDMRVAVEVHAKEYLELPISELDLAAMEEIRASYLAGEGQGHRPGGGTVARKHTAGGANQVVKNLRALINWVVEVDDLTLKPIKIKKLRPQEKARPVLWPEQIREFLSAADGGGRDSQSKKPTRKPPQSATGIRLAVGLGLREGEILQADWGWIDWRGKSFVVGGVSAAGFAIIKDRSIRTIPIPRWLTDHLHSLWMVAGKPSSGLILSQEERTKHTAQSSKKPVVRSYRTVGVVGAKHQAQFLKKPVARCGLLVGVAGLTPHCLRATWATGHFEAGTPLSQIQQMMGHSSPSTTLKYIVSRPKDQAESQERLARAMGLSEPPIVTKKFKRLLQNNKIKILIKLPGAS